MYEPFYHLLEMVILDISCNKIIIKIYKALEV